MAQKNVSRRSFVAGGAAATAGALALGLAGCGGSSKSTDSSSGTSSSTGTATSEGGSITAAVAYSSTNYTPVDMCGGSALMIGATWHVFEGLYDLDMTTYEPYAALAAGDPEKVSDTEFVVTLRDGAKFSDGSDVTAEDVVYAIETNIDTEKAPTISPMLDFIDSVEAKGDNAVTIKTNVSAESILQGRLSLIKIFPKAAEADLATLPIGSGPWAYEAISGDDGGSIDFKKNEYYNGSKEAGAATMHWDVLKDDTARATAIVDGSDIVCEKVPDANAEQIEGAGATVEYVDGFSQAFFMFNCAKKPFDDYRVRQAFFYAIDVDKLIENQLVGHAKAIKGFLPEDSEYYTEAETVYTYDPEKAKALLKEAGQESLKIELVVNNNWVSNLSAQIKEDLDAVGIETTLNVCTIDWASYAESDDELPYDVMLTPGDPTCFSKDPDILFKWWYGNNVWTKGRSCWAKADKKTWQDVQDKLDAAIVRETGRAEAYAEITNIIAEQVPLYGLLHCQVPTGYYADKISGFKPISTTGLNFMGATAAE